MATSPPWGRIRWQDGPRSFGWVSILLHWLGAAAIITLLFAGNSIHASKGVNGDAALRFHTTVALSAYALLWVRVIWRVARGHPRRLPRQSRGSYAIATPAHWILLAAIAIMLVTGPLLAWAGGLPLRLFSLEIPSPIEPTLWLFGTMRIGHLAAAWILGWGTLLHVLAVIKHMAVDRDGSFDRMMVPYDDREAGEPPNERTSADDRHVRKGRSDMTHVSVQ
jgi:cytochrome b561